MEKQLSRKRKLDLVMGILMQVYFLIPWMGYGNTRYNTLGYLLQCLLTGDYMEMYQKTFQIYLDTIVELEIRYVALWFLIACVVGMLIQVTSLIYLIAAVRGKCPGIWFQGVLMMVVFIVWTMILSRKDAWIGNNVTGIGSELMYVIITPNSIHIFLVLIMSLEVIWVTGRRVAEQLDAATGWRKKKKGKPRRDNWRSLRSIL